MIEIQHRFVETWNHLAPTGRKLEWFAADKGIVKRSAVFEAAVIVHLNNLAFFDQWPSSLRFDQNLQTRWLGIKFRI